MNTKVHGGFALFVVVTFIIGILTYLLGCNPYLANQCIAYDSVEGTVYDYSFTTQTCKRCTARGRRNTCTRYYYYACYSAYVKYHYGHNETCLYQTTSDNDSEYAAHNSVKRYDVGEKKPLIKMKGGTNCSDLSTGLATWGAGVTFLSLCGLALFIWMMFSLFEWCSNINNGVPLSASMNNMAKVSPMAVAVPVASYEEF